MNNKNNVDFGYILNFLKATITQLREANSAVEYVSWVSACIFTVLGVFTIFLAYQFQNNISETRQVIWRIRNSLAGTNINELKSLLNDFKYYSNPSPIVNTSVHAVKFVLYMMIPIWGLSGLSITIAQGFPKGEGVRYFSILLTLGITLLFIYFSFKLIVVLNKVSEGKDSPNEISNVDDFNDLTKVNNLGFDIKRILELNNLTWIIILNSESPFTQVKLTDELGLRNYSVMLTFEGDNASLYLGDFIKDREKSKQEREFHLSEGTARKINRMLEKHHPKKFEIYVSFFLGGVLIYNYKTIYDIINEGELPREYQIRLSDIAQSWKPSSIMVKKFLEHNHIEDADC